LEEFFRLISPVDPENWIDTAFQALRQRRGDYGYFIRQENELIFCNLVPLRPNQQQKKLLRLISETCERQFSKTRPSLLWLHLQGLEPPAGNARLDGPPLIYQKLARHAFQNQKRDHLSSLIFSTDTELDRQTIPFGGREVRAASATGRVEGFDNPQCRFGQTPVFVPLFKE
jgi:hypothetical protein